MTSAVSNDDPREALPPPERAALLLDMDGTLIDIAPAPDLVVVPDGLPDLLRRLRDRLGGALAVVTGRPLEQVDALLPDVPTAVAAEHGGVLRMRRGGEATRPALPEPPAAWLDEAAALVKAHPGAMLERKRRGFVLHYRAAPQAGPALRAGLERIVAEAGDRFQVMPAHMAWELKPHGADKGTAVEALMRCPPFAGRLPIYVGDDVTDQDGIRAARALGGVGLFVPEVFGDPAGVRAWLRRLATEGAPWDV